MANRKATMTDSEENVTLRSWGGQGIALEKLDRKCFEQKRKMDGIVFELRTGLFTSIVIHILDAEGEHVMAAD